jgi:hypothetical protein
VIAPVGPTGCEDAAHGAYFVGASGGAMRTHIEFDEGTFELTEQAVTVFAGYSAPSGWSYRGSLGVIVDGSIDDHDMTPGGVGAAGISRQWVVGRFFITGSASASVAIASANDERFTAGDFRIGAIVGRTFGIVSPYVLARGFGGPVWLTVDGTSTVGSDTRHFQLGAGLSLTTSSLTIVVDVSALGEQAASLGASWRL